MIDTIRPGVLNKDQIISLKGQFIKGLENEIDFSAFDLHVCELGWQMKGSIKGSNSKMIEEITNEYGEEFLLDEPKTLERRKTYIFKLCESLTFPEDSKLFCMATGKSSIGRLDVLGRLMVNNCPYYDEIKKESYNGNLYLEVTPITFNIKVKSGLSFNQLRLFRGNPESCCKIDDEQLELYPSIILNEMGQPKKIEDIHDLSVDLTPDVKGISAFEAIDTGHKTIDLTQGKNHNDPKQFWTDIKLQNGEPLKIETEKFYILRSKERFKLPWDVAVYCQAMSEKLGELRIHYAGFVHPGFGTSRKSGAPVIFEVRGHNVSNFLQDGEVLARIDFYRMSESCKPGDDPKSAYEDQELNLSNYFKKWE